MTENVSKDRRIARARAALLQRAKSKPDPDDFTVYESDFDNKVWITMHTLVQAADIADDHGLSVKDICEPMDD